MSSIFLATHPRSMSTALERSFMTRDDVTCAHEPFGDPFYFGPERLSDRYPEEKRLESEYSNTTYADVYRNLVLLAEKGERENRRLFIKDMASYLMPENGQAAVADSFLQSGSATSTPTVLPSQALLSFQYVFLIRAPHLSVPSYYKRCIPPDCEKTGFDHYRPQEAGYKELRLLYEYLVENNQRPLIVDASDIIQDPKQTLELICKEVNLPFHESMLAWDENNPNVVRAFEKWNGWHDDCLNSNGFNCNSKKRTEEFEVDYDKWEKQWSSKFDAQGVAIIRKCVEEYLDDYLFLRKNKMELSN